MTEGVVDPESSEAWFFRGKRPWSIIKDRVLHQYMRPYLTKVATLGRPIVLIDAFAGPGKFDDGSPGSPLLICQAAEACVRGKYFAVFANRERKHHERLSDVLSQFIDQGSARTLHGTAEKLLAAIQNRLADHTVFLYLDPFGLKGCDFSLLEPILLRDKIFSTEIVINLSIPTMHRLATRKAVVEGRANTTWIRS